MIMMLKNALPRLCDSDSRSPFRHSILETSGLIRVKVWGIFLRRHRGFAVFLNSGSGETRPLYCPGVFLYLQWSCQHIVDHFRATALA